MVYMYNYELEVTLW